jgi:hypothetical protein
MTIKEEERLPKWKVCQRSLLEIEAYCDIESGAISAARAFAKKHGSETEGCRRSMAARGARCRELKDEWYAIPILYPDVTQDESESPDHIIEGEFVHEED